MSMQCGSLLARLDYIWHGARVKYVIEPVIPLLTYHGIPTDTVNPVIATCRAHGPR